MNVQVLSDQVLLNHYLSGDKSAISKLIERHSRRVRDYINMMVKDRDVAEDIFQETFIKAVRVIDDGRYTVREGRRVSSPSMIANAWHHRSDALSSLGTLAGIGCAYFLGDKWRIADPIAALVVAVFIFKIAFDLIRTGLDELLERSLPEDVEEEILRVVAANPEVREPHNLRTRRIGASIAVEVHVRVDGAMSVCRSHELTEDIERRLRARFGEGTMIAIHVEPLKAACRAE